MTAPVTPSLVERLRGAVRLLPGKIVLQKGAVSAVLDSASALKTGEGRGQVSLDLRPLAGLPGAGAASYVLKGAAAALGSLDFGQVISRGALEHGYKQGQLSLRLAAYDLCLVPAGEAEPALVTAMRAAHGDKAGIPLAGGGAIEIPWTLCEKEHPEGKEEDFSWLSKVYGLGEGAKMEDFLALPFPETRIATGGVLQPEAPDSSPGKTEVEPGVIVESTGDIYDAQQIKRAERFWMAYTGGRTTVGHMRQGGFDPKGDVRVLESWVTRAEFAFADGSVPRVGTWVLSNWFPGDDAWAKVEKGEHRAYSLGSWFSYILEQA